MACFGLVAMTMVTGTSMAQSPSVAREWVDVALQSIRDDLARPVVHARNLFHLSAVMWNAWAVWEDGPLPWEFDESFIATSDVEAARKEAISHAAFTLLNQRFISSPGYPANEPIYTQLMLDLGYDPSNTSVTGNSPAAVGNRIAQQMILFGFFDGANELIFYSNQIYQPLNVPLIPPLPGVQVVEDINRWQPLALDFFVDQSGNIIPGGYPEFLGAEWGSVVPFSLDISDCVFNERDDFTFQIYHDPGAPPMIGEVDEIEFLEGFEQVLIWSSHLDPSNTPLIDISPNTIGNAILPSDPQDYPDFYDYFEGGDASLGYAANPVTGQTFDDQIVPLGDYARVLAEFWADGPDSETPPGHWFVILNEVSDHPLLEKRIGGYGPVVGDLEWDVKSYFGLGGCMHDAAITAWGAKGWYDYARPISAIRWMAEQGQRTNMLAPNYSPQGLRLIPDLIEEVTVSSSALGERHAHLAEFDGSHIGKIAAKAWRGPDAILDPNVDVAGTGWILVENWWPYQRPTFVTPNFAGYVSGHSTFSRAAAEFMTLLTGSPYFPGGLAEFPANANSFLVFEQGPSVDIVLQWVSYRDASDQCSLSRIWGGIHPIMDDLPGRIMGLEVGPDAWNQALIHFATPGPCLGDVDGDGIVGGSDLGVLLSEWQCATLCDSDLDQNGLVDGGDLGLLLSSWGVCN